MSSQATDSPFTGFDEMVCRHDASHPTTLQREFVNFVFHMFAAHGKYRRFAGDVLHAVEGLTSDRDYNLPRGRYYALCNTRHMENIHLCYEMKAYTDVDRIGPTLLADASRKQLCQQYSLDPVADALFALPNAYQIDVLLKGIGGGLHNELQKQLRESRHSIPSMNWEGAVIYFPLKKQRLVIERCIDLRRPNTRNWFFDRYRRGLEGWPGYGYDAADVLIQRPGSGGSTGESAAGFLQMVPALCYQELGGGLITQVIGADLRRHGAECLIYPSARCDTFVVFENGSLIDSYGWTLVDYRGVPTPKSPAEEGVMYSFLADMVLDSNGRFSETNSTNMEKIKSIGRQSRHVKELTGKEPRAMVSDLHSPWTPTGFPYGTTAWPYKLTDVTDGVQRGSFAIEGVQKAFDERETRVATEYIKKLQSRS